MFSFIKLFSVCIYFWQSLWSSKFYIDFRDVVAKMLDCNMELQSRYYIHFRTKSLGKGMNAYIPSALS